MVRLGGPLERISVVKLKTAIAAFAGMAVMGSAAAAATIGSLDSTRTYQDHYLTGSQLSDLRGAMVAGGHTVAAATGQVTAGYLETVDVFFTGLVDWSFSSDGRATSDEIAALQDWVATGGTLVVGGDNLLFAWNVNTWLEPFGLSQAFAVQNGGTWSAGDNPLLAGGVAGAELEFRNGSYFQPGDFDTLATVNDRAAIVEKSYGPGTVIGIADVNFMRNRATAPAKQFFINVADAAESDLSDVLDSTGAAAPVPLPAGLPLFAGAVLLLTIAGARRRKG